MWLILPKERLSGAVFFKHEMHIPPRSPQADRPATWHFSSVMPAAYSAVLPVKNAREGWDNAFKVMGEKGDDKPFIDEKSVSHSWDEEEWQW